MKPTFLLLLLTSSLCFGQSRKGPLSDIRNKYQLIRELVDSNALRQHHTNYSCEETAEEGTLTFYYNGTELKHIVHIYKEGHVQFRDEFYVWDNQLFFQYAIHNIWYKDYEKTKSGKRKLVNVTLTLEERFYFKDREVIKCQFKDFENRSNSLQRKTQHVRNKNIGCEQAQEALEKFDILAGYQEQRVADACDLPRSIKDSEIHNLIYSSAGIN
ncbi:hypothetical protein [Aquimarina spongiae]|uniref:Uncharacterized protein n=1 Tax=Aquimarina spongiae TaxID=570521 RepID=A0A1M6G4X0_9FLAO|nr:hypothetical protein [Aquimarina spongiae]SHJ04940.1 hypothetical protein SAMN04488508_10574 [Aquimarina spongiae]